MKRYCGITLSFKLEKMIHHSILQSNIDLSLL